MSSGFGDFEWSADARGSLLRARLPTTDFPEITIASIAVVPVLPEISISDDTVVPGQRVTIRATGFARDDTVRLFLDEPESFDCASCLLATAPTNTDWSAVITVRLPRDLSPGAHTLFLAGWGPEFLFPEELEVGITVGIGATTLPAPTPPATDSLVDAPPDPSPAGWPTVLAVLAGVIAASLLIAVRRPARHAV